MDSTAVAQIVEGANRLGMTARDAFMMWLIFKLASNVLTLLVIAFAIHRVTLLLQNVGWGQFLVAAVRTRFGAYPKPADFHTAAERIRATTPS